MNAEEKSYAIEVIAQTVRGATRSDVGDITLAMNVLDELNAAGLTVIRSDSWRLRSDFDVASQDDEGPG